MPKSCHKKAEILHAPRGSIFISIYRHMAPFNAAIWNSYNEGSPSHHRFQYYNGLMTWMIWGSPPYGNLHMAGSSQNHQWGLEHVAVILVWTNPRVLKKSNDHGLRRSKNKTTQHFLVRIEHVRCCFFSSPIDPENCSEDILGSDNSKTPWSP